jgi:AcrR family transcriptional regulator
MASPARAPAPALQRKDWIAAAVARLSDHGIEAVRVEALARVLGVSKGSFYWHFRNRMDLLEQILLSWESGEMAWIDAANGDSAAGRWAALVARTADPEIMRTEVAIRSWARRDVNVALRASAVEKKRTALIASVLRDVGFPQAAAESWSQIVLLVCLGWLDRATRDRQFHLASQNLGEFLSDVVLAASDRSSALNP